MLKQKGWGNGLVVGDGLLPRVALPTSLGSGVAALLGANLG